MKNITWYQCTDLPNFYSKNEHQSYREAGSVALEGILRNPENEGKFVKVYNPVERAGLIAPEDDIVGVFVIQDATLVPERFA